ncbi:hypothetical protein FRB90_006957 [Tulasnella sp. 427]|nr:hypothetical protein FRB90_006957 [Tulasnella sp. 427]
MLRFLTLLSLLAGAQALENGLARTPQMGWNTWNHFGCEITEDLILSAARVIVKTGLKDLGYEYVLIDDCWQAAERDPKTKAPVANPKKFPNGIKHLADEIHKMGLKMGIYSDAGSLTCGGYFGSLDYEEIDAKQYAAWEVDYLKYDNCFNEGRSGTPQISQQRYAVMSKALNATGRPILYSMCNWGEDQPWNWATTIANSWRISGDITDSFNRFDERCPCTQVLDCKLAGYHCAVARIIDFAAPLGQKAGPGRFNDLDMLEVGNSGMTYDEYVTHFSMWAILKSPLILGNDLNDMSDETFAIITNEAIIAVSQDPMGSPANRIWKKEVAGGDLQLWVGGLTNESTVVALLNTGEETIKTSVSIADVFTDGSDSLRRAAYRLYDLWGLEDNAKLDANVTMTPRAALVPRKDGKRYGKYEGIVRGHIKDVVVKPHQTRVWKLSGQGDAKTKLKARGSRYDF